MAKFSRALALLRALVATGIVPMLDAPELGRGVGIAISGAAHEDACDDCTADCTFCVCCPLRAAPPARVDLLSRQPTLDERFVLPAGSPPPRVDAKGIFHPPRA
jgi:hypothetical protein